MSSFPSHEEFSLIQSNQHLSKLPKNNKPFILKKAKGVNLYDLDGNKYTDFSLGKGTINEHSPSRFTKFMKNALSSGMNSQGFYSKFMLKSQKNWKQYLGNKHISFHHSLVDMLLVVIQKFSIKKIAYTSDYLYSLVYLLNGLIEFKKIDSLSDSHDSDLVLFEEYNDSFTPLKTEDLKILSIKIHDRFLYRGQSAMSFVDSCMHYIGTIAFGGKSIGVLHSKDEIPYDAPSFDEGILFLEASKCVQNMIFYPSFHHDKFTCYKGFAISSEMLDQRFFLERGIYLEGKELYFSSKHSIHDMKRLNKALNEYFIQV